MKNKSTRLFYALAVLVISSFASCKKESEASTQEKLAGKWTMESAIGTYTYQGQTEHDTTYFTSSDFVQFNADGTVIVSDADSTYSGKWKLSDKTLTFTDTQYMDYPNGFTITEITNTKLQLYYKQQEGTTSLEQKITLKK